MTTYSLVVAPVLATLALMFAGLGIVLLRNSYPPGSTALGVGMFAVALWVGGAGIELLVHESSLLLTLARDVKYVGISFAPPLFLLFVVRYVVNRAPPRALVATLLLVPVVSVVVVWSNPLHELMYPHPPSLTGPRPPWGPYFRLVHSPALYAMMLTAWGILTHEMIRGTTLRRAQAAILWFGSAPPLVVNAVFVLDRDVPDVQLTSLSFALTAVVFGWGFFRYRLFQVNPLALRAVFDAVGDAVFLVDVEGRVADANPVACRLVQAKEGGEVLGEPVREIMRRAGLDDELPAPAAPAEMVTAEGRHIEVEVRQVLDRQRDVARGRVVMLRDVTQRRRAEAALREGEAMVRTVLERAPIGICRVRPIRDETDRVRDFRCVLANPIAQQWIAADGAPLVGRTVTDIRPPHTAVLLDALRRVVRTRSPEELVLQVDAEGRPAWFRVDTVPVGDDVVVTFVDISDERQRQRAIAAEANQDALTGLLNRRGMEEDATLLVESARADGRPVALLFVDLDDFKNVNDRLGHAAGDEVLRSFAQRIQACVRAEDLVGRVGGDEFVVLMQEGEEALVEDVAERLVAMGRRPYRVGDSEAVVGVSLGWALMPRDGVDLRTLMRAADRAMYADKGARRR